MDYVSKPETTTSSPAQEKINWPTRNPILQRPSPKRAAYVDVFVDDFIALVQGCPKQLGRIRRALFHNIDLVFRPLDGVDSTHRRQPISIKKLKKGDCSWDYVKVILGWEVNTKLGTINLPPHRVDRLLEILSQFPASKRRTTLKIWQKFVGELRSMALAVPGARGLFSQMQYALTNLQNKHRVTLTKDTHAAISDFKYLANDIVNRPTRIAELIPLHPSVIGAHDASGKGAGGVFFAAQHVARRPTPCSVSPFILPPAISPPPPPPPSLPPQCTPWAALTPVNRTDTNTDPALTDVRHPPPIVYRMPFPPPRGN